MRIGAAVMRPVVELEGFCASSASFVNGLTTADIEPHAHWLSPSHMDAETGECLLSLHAWLIEAGGKRILVDPCVGHQRHRPALSFFHRLDSPLIDNLAALGVSPDSVDYVFCTHLHLDHCGWNTRLQDGRYVPTFPNARYLFSRAEDDYWRRELTGDLPQAEAFNLGAYAESVQPVIAAGLADMAEPGTRIADCLTLIEAAGHTIGHMAGVLESAGEGAVLAGDAIHHPLQVIFPGRSAHAFDEAQHRATQHRLLTLCAENDYWLAPAHFRAPHACKIREEGGRYRMEWATS